MTKIYKNCTNCGKSLRFQMVIRGTCAKCHAIDICTKWNNMQRLKKNKKR